MPSITIKNGSTTLKLYAKELESLTRALEVTTALAKLPSSLQETSQQADHAIGALLSAIREMG